MHHDVSDRWTEESYIEVSDIGCTYGPVSEILSATLSVRPKGRVQGGPNAFRV